MTALPFPAEVPENKIFCRCTDSLEGLPDALLRLLEAQREDWPQLADGVRALSSVRVRRLPLEGTSVLLQFNPVRIVSTSAKVDAGTIRQRRCFLCVPHLPEPQQGILVLDAFLVLCNPAPIFFGHFTISHIAHRPQQLAHNVGSMLDLARGLSPRFTVFYNGPQCGASAPDHLHFQACPTGGIPIEKEAAQSVFRREEGERHGVAVARLANVGRGTILLEGDERRSLAAAVERLMDAIGAVLRQEGEPKVNILCSYADRRWRLIVFPRRKHRPDAFFREGEEQVMISPAAVDIGGLVITPLERDYDRTDAALVRSIFREVSVDDHEIDRILETF